MRTVHPVSVSLCMFVDVPRQDQKAAEVAILKRLRSLDTCFPSGAMDPSESPDFLVGSGQRRLGIEVVTYRRDPIPRLGSIARRGEHLRNAIWENALGLVFASCPGLLNFTPYWHDVSIIGRYITQRASRPMAQSLAEVILQSLPPDNGGRKSVDRADLERRGLAQILQGLDIRRDPRATAGLSVWAELGPQPLRAPEVAAIIREKESRLPAYRQRCAAVWLVIAAWQSAGDVSQSVTISPETVTFAYTSTCDRLLLIHLGPPNPDQLFELAAWSVPTVPTEATST
jgi:hypothetical protein